MKHSFNNVWTVMTKELRRFFGDRRMLVTLILPGVLIYVLYTLMGNVMTDIFKEDETSGYRICAENLPLSVQTALEALDVPIEFVTAIDDPAGEVQSKQVDLYAVFPEDFDTLPENAGMTASVPEVRLYYNSTSTASVNAYTLILGLLDSMESSVFNLFNVNSTEDSYDLATARDTTGTMLSTLMPMLLLSLLFSGCMAVAPESIAGEKERGTLATMLVTPMRRSELAVGKIAALTVVALVSGLCSFLGTMLSLPTLMDSEAVGMDTAIYGAREYVCLLVIMLSTVLLFVAVISVISALADSVKAASGMVTPLMAVIMLLSLSTSFLPEVPAPYAYMIPLYNSVRCIGCVFSLEYSLVHILLTALSNLLLTGVLAFVLTKLFNSEKVMFGK